MAQQQRGNQDERVLNPRSFAVQGQDRAGFVLQRKERARFYPEAAPSA
jgi:hypothetical protein